VECQEATYGQTRGWDSLGHMTLVSQIEDEFDLLLGHEEIIDMVCFARTCDVLSKHGIVGLS
jgi:acyl carrier protein